MPAQTLTIEVATLAYAVLVEFCGASPQEDDVATFVGEFTSENPTSEYRFQGDLGFGGKFRFPALSVDCYPEHSTPTRIAMMHAANAALAELKSAQAPGARPKP